MAGTMKSRLIPWKSIDSKSAYVQFVETTPVLTTFETADPNSWGYFEAQSGELVAVAYRNVGLRPTAVLVGDSLFIGINEVFTAIDLRTRNKKFEVNLPTIFHEFVFLGTTIIVRDEVGFLGFNTEGVEKWKFLTLSPIANYRLSDNKICGETIENEQFEFLVPGD